MPSSTIPSNSAVGASNAATPTVSSVGQLTSSVSTLSFGNVNVGSSSIQSVMLTNSSGDSVAVSDTTIAGAGFTVNGISSGLILSPGASVTMNVIFAPASSGGVTGTLRVTSNASNSPLTISFSATGQVAPHSATLNWTASTSVVVGYNVYRGLKSGGPYTKLNSSPTQGTIFADTSVVSGSTYYYVVTAVDSKSAESIYSNQATAAVP